MFDFLKPRPKYYVKPEVDYFTLYDDMAKQAHLLIAGQTGSGKSVTINGIIYTLLRHTPQTVQLILIDPKKTELLDYSRLPHTIQYAATSDADTLCNPTNHLYISVNGNTSYDDTDLYINAEKYTPLNSNQLPTGEIASVAGTKYDYQEKRAFSKNDEYDDNYVLKGEGFRTVASLTGHKTFLEILVETDRPCMQLYKAGQGQICLETQMMPDAINHSEFDQYGSTILRAGETFTSKTTYTFLAID